MRYLIALITLTPAFALAYPATVNLSWEPVTSRTDGSPMTPAGYEAACGFAPDALQELVVNDDENGDPGTAVTWETDLPTAQGTVTCEVRSVGQAGALSRPAVASAPWTVFAGPSAPIVIDMQLKITCPEGYTCDVQVSP